MSKWITYGECTYTTDAMERGGVKGVGVSSAAVYKNIN